MGSKCRFYVDIQSLSSGVTGSCHLCIVRYPDCTFSRFIVDCGLFQGTDEKGDENFTFPFNANNIDFVLVTHNHVDHIGRLPLLYKNGYEGKIYTTPPTSMLLPLSLYDSFKVLKDTCKRRNIPTLYSDSNVGQALKNVQPIPFCKSVELTENIKVTFFYNGHLIGAALILVEISYPGEENINLLFTGDYNNKNIFFDVPPLPQEVLDLPINIMQECTYGYMDSDEIAQSFETNILEAINNNASIVVPVFSLGRSQEILYFLKNLQETGKLSTSIPTYFDGRLAHRYTELYLKKDLGIKDEMTDFLPSGLQFVDASIRDSIIEDNHSKIILTTSGMGSYGPAQLYIPAFIKRENALIHFTGYTAEGTLGHRLKTAEIGDFVKVGGLIAEKKARVEYTTEFSAHAKADELITFLQQFTNINLVLLNHGEETVKENFAKRVIKQVPAKNVGIASRDTFFRISAYHLIKTMSTKFQ